MHMNGLNSLNSLQHFDINAYVANDLKYSKACMIYEEIIFFVLFIIPKSSPIYTITQEIK